MQPDDPRLVEAVMHLCAVGGVGMHLHVLTRQDARSTQERRLIVLLIGLGTMMLLRAVALVWPSPVFKNLALAVAALLPLALFVFTEGLLRRHQPRALKAFVLAGTLAAFVLAIFGQLDAHVPVRLGFGVFALLVLIAAVAALLARQRRDLSRTENALADALTVAVIALGPLFLTDLLAGMGQAVVRAGSLGVLVFVYASLQLSEKRHAGSAVVFGLLLALSSAELFALGHAVLLADQRPLTLARTGLYFACVVLLMLIFGQMRTLLGRSQQAGLLRALATMDLRDWNGLSHALVRSPNLGRHRLLRAEDLVEHDVARLVAGLPREEQRIASLSQLRRMLRAGAGDRDAAERWIDLLERHDMTHAVVLRESPPVLLEVQARASGRDELVRLELALLARLSRGIGGVPE